MNYKTLFLLLMILSFSSCKQKSLNPEEYIEWIKDEENGLRQIKSINSIIYDLQYVPNEFHALQELIAQQNVISRQNVCQVINEYKGYTRFILKIRNEAGSDLLAYISSNEIEYQQNLAYLSSTIQNDFYLISKSDTFSSVFAHYERDYNVSPFITLTVVFIDKDISGENMLFKFNDNITGNGPVLFTIIDENITQIPKVKYPNDDKQDTKK